MFFCEKEEGKSNLRQVMTTRVDEKVRTCARIIQDSRLLAKLADGDMIAIEAKYHTTCLLDLYYQASRLKNVSSDNPVEKEATITTSNTSSSTDECNITFDAESLALAEVVAYIEEARSTDSSPSVFKLAELAQLYSEQLVRYNISIVNPIHTTRFKERLLATCPELTAVNHGRDVWLTFQDHLGMALVQIKKCSDADAVHLMHTAKLIRNEIFLGKFEFNGSLDSRSQQDSVPPILLTLANMLLEGPGNFEITNNQAALSISQQIIYNAVKRHRKNVSAPIATDTVARAPVIRHSLSQETPLSVYNGILIHALTRKKRLVNKFYKLGISVSYPRVMQISNKLANRICSQYNEENLVCPPILKKNLFTVSAVDNIDHNPSSNTAQSSFHGTAISMMQFPSSECSAFDRTVDYSFGTASDEASSISLPISYTDVPPCIFPTADPKIPLVELSLLNLDDNAIAVEYGWLDRVKECIEYDTEALNVSWAGYHAEKTTRVKQPTPIFAMLPLFRHSANTPAMIRHSLTVVETATKHLNPSQVPVVTYDQPLYALAKQIQWHWPDKFGEERFVIMMGGLHIEMAALRMLGHWLDGSGWVHALVQSEIASAGVAESFIHASHVKRSCYAHTVTAATLYICMRNVYVECIKDIPPDKKPTFEEWRVQREEISTQFKYWSTVLQLQLIMLTFVRSLREGNFELYIESLQQLAPWFFLLDQTNYARWLPVHIRDMMSLKQLHPDIEAQFVAGNFTVSKSNKDFSSISIDQAHEQLNALIKGDGGAIGLTENESALTRWVIAGPEIMRIIHEFEDSDTVQDTKNHEQNAADQKRFKDDVTKLLKFFEDNSNPFIEMERDELLSLDNQLADPAVFTTVRSAKDIGCGQFKQFFTERLEGSVSIHKPLTRNKLPLFPFKPVSKRGPAKLKVTELKTDCELFSRLYIACQSRNGDLDEFFRHENQSYPPSILDRGNLRFGTKSDLLRCFSTLVENQKDISEINTDAYVLDGAVIVQMLRPGCSKTFKEYGEKIFVPYIDSILRHVKRLDIVFDVYVSESLKSATREKRGSGTRTRVAASTKIPKNWQEFLRVDENKTELFHYLADVIFSFPTQDKYV